MDDKRTLSPDELMPEYEELLKNGARLPLVVSGSSMVPFLVSGRDSVLLAPPDSGFKKGSILFFRRKSGGYVLHRLHRRDDTGLWFVGDAQDEIEGPIFAEQVFAEVVGVRRKGRDLKRHGFTEFFFRRIWPLTVGHRKTIIGLYTKLFGRHDD